MSRVDFSFSRSEPFYKTLDIEQKAIFGRKKLALNKTNKNLLHELTFFAQLVRQRYYSNC